MSEHSQRPLLEESILRDFEPLSAKGQMAAYITHEINNSLAGIRGAFTLLKAAVPEDHPHGRYAPLIGREIDRITSIVRTMHRIFRPHPSQPRELVVMEIFDDIATLLASKCRTRSVELVIDPRSSDLKTWAHDGILRQVLFGLTQNALEASPEGGIITLGAVQDNEALVITVRDEGPGIPPALAERVFEAGFTTKPDSAVGGVGLGLCKSLMASVGGTLGFRPGEGGKGTLFFARWPGSMPTPPTPPHRAP